MTTQVLRRLEKIEASMAQREVPKPEFTLVFVDAADGRPTGKITIVPYGERAKKDGEDEQ
jgi:hypothetical protein